MNQQRIYNIINAPIVSEKSSRESQLNQTYVFSVAQDANKFEIKAAVEALFNVSVVEVRTVNLKGKKVRFRGRIGTRKGMRKAYIRVASGQTIDLEAIA